MSINDGNGIPAIGLSAAVLKFHKIAYIVDGKAKFTGMSYKPKTFEVAGTIPALIAIASQAVWQ